LRNFDYDGVDDGVKVAQDFADMLLVNQSLEEFTLLYDKKKQ
jgi:hypothetical protein